MWLWVGFYLTSAVVTAQNTVLSTKENKLPNNTKCDEVLLKLWTIFANQLYEDRGAVIVPSRDHIIYALTLIKKSILDKEDGENVDIKEKLYLREAELAKYKGVYLYDNRPLQALLDQELITNENQNVGVQSSQYNLNSPVYTKQLIGFNPIVKDSTRNRDENVANTIGQQSDLNTIDSNRILHAVQLSKETNHLLGSDYTADLDHAKGVADKMNKLYESNNEYKYSLKSQQPLRNLNENYVAASVGVVDTPWVSSFYSKPAVVQASYVAQSLSNTNNINQDRDISQPNALYNIPTQDMHNNAINQSYTLITNAMQSNANGFKNAIVNPESTNQLNNFINAKYQPNPAHYGEATKEVLPSNPPITSKAYAQTVVAPMLKFNMHKHPYQNKNVGQILQYTPQNMAQYSDVIPIKTNLNQRLYVPNNRLNYNVYSSLNPYSSKNWNYLLSKAYKQSQNQPYIYMPYANKYTPVVAVRPNNANVNNIFQQPGMNTRNSIYTMQNYLKQNYPNSALSKTILHGTPHLQTVNENAVNRPSPPYTYITRYFNNNRPYTQQTLNYYNDHMVIDKLANWISGTNSAKLNSNFDTDADIELTYRVNNPPPSYRPSVYYVKFRMPYNAFAKHLSDLLKMQDNSRSASTNTDLYNDLASQYNATVIPTDMAGLPEDIKSPEEKFLVRARYIQPDESGNDNSNSVDIINLVREAVPNNANVENPVNNV